MITDETIINNLKEDVGFEDITSNALIRKEKWTQAKITVKEDGIISGMEIAWYILDIFRLDIIASYHDGDKVNKGDVILEFEGDAKNILIAERTMLNYLMHLSGISTTVNNTVMVVNKINPNIRVACTRKTTPGLQNIEKEAVKIGGADTHRFRLDDCVLIKDNHLKLVGSVIEAIELAKEAVSFTKKIEIEVETLDDAVEAALFGADIIMLDNMQPVQIEEVIKTLEEKSLRKNVIIEVSGGITPDNISKYAKLDIDVISSGYITNSAKSLDMSLDIII
ncbi:MAG: carboxylating nicotinate-nucleotide diphosphorylase [Methanobacteriaceae archaeon]|nr:carboxylating nicotinate-nucleotide diphosphorylase [Methanobacteriaceae archaeon]